MAGLPRFPDWIKRRVRVDEELTGKIALLRKLELNTVCESANCPNMSECWHSGAMTFLILGTTCTRNCRFCSVGKGKPAPQDRQEPGRIVAAIREVGLKYVVITSPTRDDLADAGAGQFVRVIEAIRECDSAVGVEVLVPDFGGREDSVRRVLDAGPDVFAHNVETVPRLYGEVRPEASYPRSLKVLALAAGHATKSGLMLGFGEERDEVLAVLRDLVDAGVNSVTIGQYLKPDPGRLDVRRFIPPEEFDEYALIARGMGFLRVESGPFVRSSFRAGIPA